MTPSEVITLALKKIGVIGVGQTALAEDLNDALNELNMMIGQWNSTRYMLYHLVTNSVNCTGAASYTIGPGGNISVSERPDLIESAFIRQPNLAPSPIDWPLKAIPSRENYNAIALKSLQSFPSYYWYDAAYPLGLIYPYPIPNNQYQLHVTTRQILTGFTDLAQEITIPSVYLQALVYNLAAILCTSYDKPTQPEIVAIAQAAKVTIKGNNSQIPNAVLPDGLTRGTLYNIFNDQMY